MIVRYLLTLMLVFALLTACNDSPKLATVDGKAITEAEFNAFLKFKRISDKDEKKREMLLDQYLEREALAAAIEKEDLLDKDMIQAELNEFKKEMLISRFFEKYLNDTVTDQAVQNYYNTNASDYEQKKVHAAHILIRLNKKMTEPERKAKLTTAQEAYSQIKSGKDFAEVAEDYSEDKISAKKGGDLGWLKEGSVDQKFSKTLFELKPGEYSEPFETPFGFHIVKNIEGPNVVKRPFSAVSGDIRYMLRNKAKEAEMEKLQKMIKVKKESL